MRTLASWVFIVGLGGSLVSLPVLVIAQSFPHDDGLVVHSTVVGAFGGSLVVSLRSEPKTLNPVTAVDISSREVIAQMTGDLVHINRASQQSGPALAKSWRVSPDGLRYTLQLRNGIRFSDGHPMDADDVAFTFKVYLDESMHAPQRDLLVVGGKPISVRSIGAHSLVFELSQPYAAAERLFDSIAVLPRHLLQKAYEEGKLAQLWTLGTATQNLAGLGPFRLKEYVPGQRITLERNPYFWQFDVKGNRLPYLDQITFLFVTSADAEVLRFEAGDTDIIDRLSAQDYSVLEKEQTSRAFHLNDVGASLEYNFLLFNQNTTLPVGSPFSAKQSWFRQAKFREAISLAIDREGITHIVYRGLGTPLWSHVTPANKEWVNASLPHPGRSVEQARKLLGQAGFSWRPDGTLTDNHGASVEFTILTSASNVQRTQMATMIQSDLKDLGMRVTVVPLEFRAVLDRIFNTHDYEAAVMGLGGGDVDPNSQMSVWLSYGHDHLWNLGESHPETTWEAEIDQLMEKQLTTLKPKERKQLYDRVQEIEAQYLPIICLASPDGLVGARNSVGNFQPAILDPHTLWNSQELFLVRGGADRKP